MGETEKSLQVKRSAIPRCRFRGRCREDSKGVLLRGIRHQSTNTGRREGQRHFQGEWLQRRGQTHEGQNRGGFLGWENAREPPRDTPDRLRRGQS